MDMMQAEDGSTMDVNGVATFFTDVGSGRPLVLMHGAGAGQGFSLSFGTAIPALASRHRVIALDMPGYGASGSLPGQDTPDKVAEHVLGLLDRLGVDRATLIGHSRGGRVALEMEQKAPGRADAIVIIDSAACVPDGHKSHGGGVASAALSIVKFGASGKASFEEFKDNMRLWVYDPAVLTDPFLQKHYDRFIALGNFERFVAHMKTNDLLAYYARTAPALKTMLESLSLPVCVIWGREDAMAPSANGVALIELIKTLEFHVLSQCGHSPLIERPDACLAIIEDFLSRNRPA